MLLIAIVFGLGLGSLLLWRKALPEENTAGMGPAARRVKATVDGRPVHSYILED